MILLSDYACKSVIYTCLWHDLAVRLSRLAYPGNINMANSYMEIPFRAQIQSIFGYSATASFMWMRWFYYGEILESMVLGKTISISKSMSNVVASYYNIRNYGWDGFLHFNGFLIWEIKKDLPLQSFLWPKVVKPGHNLWCLWQQAAWCLFPIFIPKLYQPLGDWVVDHSLWMWLRLARDQWLLQHGPNGWEIWISDRKHCLQGIQFCQTHTWIQSIDQTAELACVEECPPFVIFSGAQPYVAKGKTNELDFVTFYAMTKQPLGPLDPCILQIMANLWFLLFSRGGAWPYAMAHIRTIWGQQHGLLWMNWN